MDYLAPFLAQIGYPERLTSAQAYKLKEDCLADLKQRLIDKANLIQLRFENVSLIRHWLVLAVYFGSVDPVVMSGAEDRVFTAELHELRAALDTLSEAYCSAVYCR